MPQSERPRTRNRTRIGPDPDRLRPPIPEPGVEGLTITLDLLQLETMFNSLELTGKLLSTLGHEALEELGQQDPYRGPAEAKQGLRELASAVQDLYVRLHAAVLAEKMAGLWGALLSADGDGPAHGDEGSGDDEGADGDAKAKVKAEANGEVDADADADGR